MIRGRYGAAREPPAPPRQPAGGWPRPALGYRATGAGVRRSWQSCLVLLVAMWSTVAIAGRRGDSAPTNDGRPDEDAGDAEHQQTEHRLRDRGEPLLHLLELPAQPPPDGDLEARTCRHLLRAGQVDDEPTHHGEPDRDRDVDRVGEHGPPGQTQPER